MMKIEDSDYSDKYEDFSLNKIKELQSFNAKNEISDLCVLNDGRILTNEIYNDEEDNSQFKLRVYSVINGFDCDLDIDFGLVKHFYPMNDGNVIISLPEEIKLVKIKKNTIEELWNEKKKRLKITKLLNQNFLLNSKENKAIQSFLYKYDNDKLISFKDLSKLFDKESVLFLCQINESEYALSHAKKE